MSFRAGVVLSVVIHVLVGGGLVWLVAASGLHDEKVALSEPLDLGLVQVGEKSQRARAAAAPVPVPVPATEPVTEPVSGDRLAVTAPVAVTATATATAQATYLVNTGEGASPLTLTKQDYARWVRSHNPPPEYPRLARGRGEQGRVVVRAWVSKLGRRAEKVELEQGSGFELLDRSVLEAVAQWQFPPFQGAETRIAVSIPFLFRLEDR